MRQQDVRPETSSGAAVGLIVSWRTMLHATRKTSLDRTSLASRPTCCDIRIKTLAGGRSRAQSKKCTRQALSKRCSRSGKKACVLDYSNCETRSLRAALPKRGKGPRQAGSRWVDPRES